MAGGDRHHADVPPGRRLRRRSSAAVVAVLVLAVAAFTFDLGPRVLGWDHPSPVTEPAEVAPPPGLSLPSPSPVVGVAAASSPGTVDPAAVRRAVAPLLRDKALGRSVAVAVRGLAEGATVFERGPSAVVPASTMKLLTTTAALATLGPDHTFRTTTVAGATGREVILVGGGDPLLARSPDGEAYPPRADLVTLAKATARSLKRRGRTRVRVGYDTSLFTGPAVSPAWRKSYVTDHVVTGISPLWADQGRRGGSVVRSPRPALDATTSFVRALERQGITVRGKPRPSVAGADAEEYAAVESAPVSLLAEHVLQMSDNEAAEVLLRHVGLATGRPGSFRGGTAAVREVLSGLGIDTSADRILDGSGLSRRNRLTTGTLLSVLDVAAGAEHPELRAVITGLPVAGFTGSLSYRFDQAPAVGLGRVRAKTGTLTGVHGLAGVVTDRDGTVLTFVAIADKVKVADTLDARAQLDRVAAALAACACSR